MDIYSKGMQSQTYNQIKESLDHRQILVHANYHWVAPRLAHPFLLQRLIIWVQVGPERHRERETDRERQRDRQTDRDRDRQRQTDRITTGWLLGQPILSAFRSWLINWVQGGPERDRERQRETETETERDRDRETERQRRRDRQNYHWVAPRSAHPFILQRLIN